MPPDSPGTYDNDYNQLIDCYNNGPENTPGCHWVIPPGGDCNSEIVGLENEVILGDLNNDLIVNIQDIIITVNLVLNGEYNSYADINLDEIVNVLDIIQIVNIVLNNQSMQIREIDRYNNDAFDDSTLKFIEKLLER